MSSIKRHNHRIHPCAPERKQELLKHLLTCNETSSILIVVSGEVKEIQELIDDKNIIVTNDSGLKDFPDLERDLVISYDLPDTPQEYMTRISHAITHALILLDPQDQIHLYPIETLLGRTLMQEVISGFEIEVEKPKERFTRDDRPKRNDKRPPRQYKDSNSRDSQDKKPYEKKKSFSERSERKSYGDKSKSSYKSSKPTGSKKVGKRVSIKAIKPKESE